MKKLLLLLFLIPLFSFAQTWTSSEGGSVFDGKYKTSSVRGKGDNFPYNKPVLVINKFKNEFPNFYISGGGYFQENSNIEVLWVFDNEPNTIYSTYSWSISDDGKILFFSQFNNPDGLGKLKPIDFIEKLMLANKVSVRMSDKYGSNDIVFSLSGSTKAINFVLPKEERDSLKDAAEISRESAVRAVAEKEKKQIEKEKKKLEKQQIFDNLVKSANYEKIGKISISTLKSQFKKDLGLEYYSSFATGKDYKSIIVKKGLRQDMFEFGYVDVYYVLGDGSEEKISGTWNVDLDAPVFARNKAKVKEQNEIAEKLVSKLNLDKLKKHYKEVIIKKVERTYDPKFEIKNIVGINMTFSNFQYKAVWDSEVTLFLDNMEKVTFKSYISDLKLSKKELKNLGITLNQPFKVFSK